MRRASSGLRARYLLAEEGINGTLACPDSPAPLQAFLGEVLGAVPGLEGLEAKWSEAEAEPFRKLKVRLKQEIVTLGVPGTRPHVSGGEHVDSRQWDAILSDPRTILIDTHNDYEVALGTFEGARNPQIASFRDFPAYVESELSQDKDRPIAMFCTRWDSLRESQRLYARSGLWGGLSAGWRHLKNIEETGADDSKWQGGLLRFLMIGWLSHMRCSLAATFFALPAASRLMRG